MTLAKKNLKQKLVDENKVNIAIVGGGATGVELTAELYHAAEDLSSYGYGKIDSSLLTSYFSRSRNTFIASITWKIYLLQC